MRMVGNLAVVAAVLIVVAWLFGGREQHAGQGSAAPTVSSAPANDPKACDTLIRMAASDGVVRATPAGNRIDVEDMAWAGLPHEDKRMLAAATACRAFGGRSPGQLTAGQYAVVYGYRSGKRLAMMSSAGFHAE